MAMTEFSENSPGGVDVTSIDYGSGCYCNCHPWLIVDCNNFVASIRTLAHTYIHAHTHTSAHRVLLQFSTTGPSGERRWRCWCQCHKRIWGDMCGWPTYIAGQSQLFVWLRTFTSPEALPSKYLSRGGASTEEWGCMKFTRGLRPHAHPPPLEKPCGQRWKWGVASFSSRTCWVHGRCCWHDIEWLASLCMDPIASTSTARCPCDRRPSGKSSLAWKWFYWERAEERNRPSCDPQVTRFQNSKGHFKSKTEPFSRCALYWQGILDSPRQFLRLGGQWRFCLDPETLFPDFVDFGLVTSGRMTQGESGLASRDTCMSPYALLPARWHV